MRKHLATKSTARKHFKRGINNKQSRKTATRDVQVHYGYLFSINTMGHRPGGGDVIHNPLAQAFGHLVELQEIPHAVEHLMVTVSVGVHLLKNSRHVTKDGGVEES